MKTFKVKYEAKNGTIRTMTVRTNNATSAMMIAAQSPKVLMVWNVVR